MKACSRSGTPCSSTSSWFLKNGFQQMAESAAFCRAVFQQLLTQQDCEGRGQVQAALMTPQESSQDCSSIQPRNSKKQGGQATLTNDGHIARTPAKTEAQTVNNKAK